MNEALRIWSARTFGEFKIIYCVPAVSRKSYVTTSF